MAGGLLDLGPLRVSGRRSNWHAHRRRLHCECEHVSSFGRALVHRRLTVVSGAEAIPENPKPSMGGGDDVAVGGLAGALIARIGNHDGVVVDGLLGSSPAARSADRCVVSNPSRRAPRVS